MFERGGVLRDELTYARVADLPQRLLLRGGGTLSAMTLRARARAEFTEVVEVFIVVAISAAEKPSTSGSTSAARQVLQGRDEGELDGLALLVARAGAGRAPARPPETSRFRTGPGEHGGPVGRRVLECGVHAAGAAFASSRGKKGSST